MTKSKVVSSTTTRKVLERTKKNSGSTIHTALCAGRPQGARVEHTTLQRMNRSCYEDSLKGASITKIEMATSNNPETNNQEAVAEHEVNSTNFDFSNTYYQ